MNELQPCPSTAGISEAAKSASGWLRPYRKLCDVIHRHLGKGEPAARSPVPSPTGSGSSRASSPLRKPQERVAVPSRARRLRSPCTHRPRGVPAPKTPDQKGLSRPSGHPRPTLRGLDGVSGSNATPQAPKSAHSERHDELAVLIGGQQVAADSIGSACGNLIKHVIRLDT